MGGLKSEVSINCWLMKSAINIAYLILAHNTPHHLGRLTKRLTAPHSKVFIHVDGKTPIDPYRRIAGSDITWLRYRVPVYWGDFSQVDAVLMLIEEAFRSGYQFDKLVLLSGSDYPICSPEESLKFFELNFDSEHMAAVRMPNEEYSKPISRLNNYRNADSDPWYEKWRVELLSRAGVRTKHRDYRAYLGPLVPYAGPLWWALSKSACQHILNFVASNTNIMEFYRHTYFPDESFFHTIIMNSKFGSELKGEITYADWSRGGANPATLSLQDVERLVSLRWHGDVKEGDGQGFLFARKFPDDSGQIVNAIDRLVLATDSH